MEKHFDIVLLMDLYQNLLTKKQSQALELYYNEDMSLGEIASLQGASRQSVFDLIKRSEALLRDYEEKLSLYKRNEKIKCLLTSLEKTLNTQEKTTVAKIKELL